MINGKHFFDQLIKTDLKKFGKLQLVKKMITKPVIC